MVHFQTLSKYYSKKFKKALRFEFKLFNYEKRKKRIRKDYVYSSTDYLIWDCTRHFSLNFVIVFGVKNRKFAVKLGYSKSRPTPGSKFTEVPFPCYEEGKAFCYEVIIENKTDFKKCRSNFLDVFSKEEEMFLKIENFYKAQSEKELAAKNELERLKAEKETMEQNLMENLKTKSLFPEPPDFKTDLNTLRTNPISLYSILASGYSSAKSTDIMYRKVSCILAYLVTVAPLLTFDLDYKSRSELFCGCCDTFHTSKYFFVNLVSDGFLTEYALSDAKHFTKVKNSAYCSLIGKYQAYEFGSVAESDLPMFSKSLAFSFFLDHVRFSGPEASFGPVKLLFCKNEESSDVTFRLKYDLLFMPFLGYLDFPLSSSFLNTTYVTKLKEISTALKGRGSNQTFDVKYFNDLIIRFEAKLKLLQMKGLKKVHFDKLKASIEQLKNDFYSQTTSAEDNLGSFLKYSKKISDMFSEKQMVSQKNDVDSKIDTSPFYNNDEK